MDDDEVFAWIFSGVIAVVFTVIWCLRIFKLPLLVCPSRRRIPFVIVLIVCLILDLIVLRMLADHQVRDDFRYIGLFLTVGIAWFMLTMQSMQLLGVSPVEDALEKSNPAATIFICCTLLATTFVYAGSNIGEGQPSGRPEFSAPVHCLFCNCSTRSFLTLPIRSPSHRDTSAGLRAGGVFPRRWFDAWQSRRGQLGFDARYLR